MRLGLAANPNALEGSLKTWRALHRAVTKRDIDLVLQTAKKRIENSRDAAVRAIALGEPKEKGKSGKAQTRTAAAA